MAKTLYRKAQASFANAGINWGTADLKVVMVDLTQYALQISGATNASPIVITTSAAHGLSTGDEVAISRVGGNTAANANWKVTVLTSTTFSLDGSTGNGAYTSGGFAVPFSVHQYLSDIPSGARVATSGNLANKTSNLGACDADDISFGAVTGATVHAFVLYKDTGTASTSNLIAYFDDAIGLPYTPNGAAVSISWDNNAAKIFRL